MRQQPEGRRRAEKYTLPGRMCFFPSVCRTTSRNSPAPEYQRLQGARWRQTTLRSLSPSRISPVRRTSKAVYP